MPEITRNELLYKNQYSWTAVPGDNPNKTREDADRFSRHEGYEVLHLINSLTTGDGKDLPKRSRLVCEWMIRNELPSTTQGRSKVIQWLIDNYTKLEPRYPY